MKLKRLPPIEELRRLFDYDPETVIVTRKVTTNNNAKKGDVVGRKTVHGYFRVAVINPYGYIESFGLHRICYALYYGRDPYPMQVDHLNHDRVDNRICNLRLVTHQENGKNQRQRKDNTSGTCGVCFHKRDNKWHAQIRTNGKNKSLGYFTNKADAIAARRAAEIKYGYHKNHGYDNEAPEDKPRIKISDEVRQLSLRLIQPVDDKSASQEKRQECKV